MLTDRFGRTIRYLRISVTDRCNLQCRYCMPEVTAHLPMAEVLTYEEIAFICAQAAGMGIDSFRITGGEPLARKGCVKLVSMLKAIPGVRRVAMTTNGVMLGDHLEDLLAAGLDGVNISLDTLDREEYRAITGADELNRVTASIRQAAGRLPVKVNCVICRGINDGAPAEMAALARDLPVDVRFIEMMPVGAGKGMDPVASIRKLGDAIFHFHAKDTKVDKYNTAVNGVLDTKPYSDEIHRSWVFRSVGYGNDELYWKDIISNLRMVGYDHAISIEHEDSIMSQKEGLERAVSMLKRCIMGEQPGSMWWV